METLPPIASACAVTAIAMYPVDVARALKMASATGPGYSIGEFVKTHGIKGVLSQGVMPEVIRATWMRMLKFFFFPLTFTAMYGKPVSKGTPLEKGLAGAIAVTPEVATITTLELAKIGLQLDSQKRYNNSAIALVKDVYAKRGAMGCMAGWQGVQARQMLWTGTYFATIDLFKNLVTPPLSGLGEKKTPLVNFLAGFFAGVAGAAANTPWDVCRTNIQKEFLQRMTPAAAVPGAPAVAAAAMDSNARYAMSFGKMVSVGKEIIAAKGIRSLYAGFGFKALHMGGSGACVAMLIPVFGNLFGVKTAMM